MVQLRFLSDADIPALGALLSSSLIQQTYMVPDFHRPDDFLPLIQRLIRLSREEDHFVRGIYADGALVGLLNDVEAEHVKIELGYVIHPRFWGMGYATAALKLAIEALFHLGWQEVTAGAFAENAASIRVMEKAGMHRLSKTDVTEYRGKQHSCVYCSITK